MAWTHWVIVILLLIAWSQYTYPNKTSNLTGKAFDPLNDFISDKTNFQPGNDCPLTWSPVCADNTTFANSCLANAAGATTTKPGECDGTS